MRPEQPVTIDQIARICGVSKGTVSRALTRPEKLRPETLERIRQVMRENNYVPNPAARAMNYERTNTLSIVAPDIRFSFQCELIKGAQQALHERGYNLLVVDSSLYQQRATDYLHMLRRQVTLGTIFCFENDTAAIESMNSMQPVVSYELARPGICSVLTDVQRGMELMLEHLDSNGHRRIALVVGRREDDYSQRSLQAFETVCGWLGIARPEEYTVCGQWSRESGREAMARLLALPAPPTAVLYYSCTMAQGGMMECCDRGIGIPEGISIATLDGAEENAYLTPGITTVDLDVEAMGRRLADMIAGGIADRSAPILQEVVTPGGVRPGRSVKDIAGSGGHKDGAATTSSCPR